MRDKTIEIEVTSNTCLQYRSKFVEIDEMDDRV